MHGNIYAISTFSRYKELYPLSANETLTDNFVSPPQNNPKFICLNMLFPFNNSSFLSLVSINDVLIYLIS